jgi:hypothetical protein
VRETSRLIRCPGPRRGFRKPFLRFQLYRFPDNWPGGLQSVAGFPMLKASKCRWINQRRLGKG